jgi:hypothetical protein
MQPFTSPTNELLPATPRISVPVIPAIDWRPIRGSLGSVRAGYDDIELFINQLLDEIDTAWNELADERSRGKSAAESGQHSGSESRGLVSSDDRAASCELLPAVRKSDITRLDEDDAAQLVQLEHQRVALQTEVNLLRAQLAAQTDQFAQERRQTAQERLAWADELRQLREAIHRQMETFNLLPAALRDQSDPRQSRKPTAASATHAANDPVVGPLLAQLKTLQRDAERRRKGEAGDDISASGQASPADRSHPVRTV